MSNKNKSRLIKRLITGAMCLTLVFSINGFASVVSDNDGSAFITKAEFDSLKNNFQSQIDQYNTSIDSKIDGAIAAYLSGIKIETRQNRAILFYDKNGVLMNDNDHPLKYQLGYSYIHGITGMNITQIKPSANLNGTQARLISITGNTNYWNGANSKPFKKLLISDLDTTKTIAAWVGYATDAREQVGLQVYTYSGSTTWNPFPDTPAGTTYLKNSAYSNQNIEYNVNGATFTTIKSTYSFNFFDTYNNYIDLAGLQIMSNTIENKNLCVFSNKNHYEFQSNTVATNCAFINNVAYSNFTEKNKLLKDFNSECILSERDYISWMNICATGSKNAVSEANLKTGLNRQWNNAVTWQGAGMGGLFIPLIQGFESRGGFDQWKQIYKPDYDDIANEYNDAGKTYNVILKDKVNKPHIAITAGFPLLRVNGKETISYKISPKEDGDLPLYLWIKTEPFDLVKTPQAEVEDSTLSGKFLSLSGDKNAVWDTTKKSLKIVQKETTVKFEIPEDEDDHSEDGIIIWMKWSYGAGSGGGELNLEKNALVQSKD